MIKLNKTIVLLVVSSISLFSNGAVFQIQLDKEGNDYRITSIGNNVAIVKRGEILEHTGEDGGNKYPIKPGYSVFFLAKKINMENIAKFLKKESNSEGTITIEDLQIKITGKKDGVEMKFPKERRNANFFVRFLEHSEHKQGSRIIRWGY